MTVRDFEFMVEEGREIPVNWDPILPHPNVMWYGPEFDVVPQGFRPWFRGLPTVVRWLVGLAILTGCVLAALAFVANLDDPRAPQQGFWFTLLLFVASLVLSELLRPKPKTEESRPAGLGDFQFPTATETRMIPILKKFLTGLKKYGLLDQNLV